MNCDENSTLLLNKLHCEINPVFLGGREGEHTFNWRFSFVLVLHIWKALFSPLLGNCTSRIQNVLVEVA